MSLSSIVAIVLFAAAGLTLLSAAVTLHLATKPNGILRPRWQWALVVLLLGGISLVAGDHMATKVGDSIAANVTAKYDVVGPVELLPSLSSLAAKIKRIELADARTIISGTITLASSGEPTISDPVYMAADGSVPVRK